MEQPNEQPRTSPQNRAYNKWIQEVADECVEKGVNLVALFKDPAEIPVTKESLHKGMTHRLIKLRYDKTSTADLTVKEMMQTVEDLRMIISQRSKGAVDLPFPSQTIKQLEEYDKNMQALKDF